MYEANRRYWNAMAPDWEKLRDKDRLWRSLPEQPELAFDGEALPQILRSVGEIRDKKALLIASRDNYVSFALARMAQRVTRR